MISTPPALSRWSGNVLLTPAFLFMLKMIKSMNRSYYALLLAFYLLAPAPLAQAQTTVYVDARATGTDDGS